MPWRRGAACRSALRAWGRRLPSGSACGSPPPHPGGSQPRPRRQPDPRRPVPRDRVTFHTLSANRLIAAVQQTLRSISQLIVVLAPAPHTAVSRCTKRLTTTKFRR
ncbi:hypothetical protein WR25_21720 [Diploscapter pachys]|uniref:Uncharacterized protein n=1 Tax=Diploscapter pachys TaxID=2018661 RepID=A0A2A2KAQ2_9BILA|nr:hypothetical protein WR25_21720 [Diploscapter pachys]